VKNLPMGKSSLSTSRKETPVRSDTKAELQMLREFFWLQAPHTDCYFCKEPLITPVADMTFGHRRHPPIDVKISVHHIDHNRENNSLGNLAPAHRRCHEAYHAKERADVRRASRVQDSGTIPQSTR
jgi:hypothetical protein